MSLWKFIGWFVVGLVLNVVVTSMTKNAFIIAFFNGLLIGFLGAKD